MNNLKWIGLFLWQVYGRFVQLLLQVAAFFIGVGGTSKIRLD